MSQLQMALLRKDVDLALQLIRDKTTDLSTDIPFGLYFQMGSYDVPKVLLTEALHRVNPKIRRCFPLTIACCSENVELIQLILRNLEPDLSNDDVYAIYFSCGRGNIEIVNLLLKSRKMNSATCFNCIRVCCQQEHPEILEIFMKDAASRVYPDGYLNPQIVEIVSKGRVDIISILCKDKRVDKKRWLKSAIEYKKREVTIFLTMELIGDKLLLCRLIGQAMDILEDIIGVIQMNIIISEI